MFLDTTPGSDGGMSSSMYASLTCRLSQAAIRITVTLLFLGPSRVCNLNMIESIGLPTDEKGERRVVLQHNQKSVVEEEEERSKPIWFWSELKIEEGTLGGKRRRTRCGIQEEYTGKINRL